MAAVLQDDAGRSATFQHELQRIRTHFDLYPRGAAGPAEILGAASHTVRSVAADCLPLGIGIVMHLYPLCALQCAPLPALSIAGFKRRILMKVIRDRSMLVANAGGERANGSRDALAVALDDDGLRVSGTCDYVSLASVADVVLFSAAHGDRTVVCAADLRADSVRVGAAKFTGRMQLSDTRPLTFMEHRIPPGRYLLTADPAATRCMFDYQRCWFHLLLAEAYLARIAELQKRWRIARNAGEVMELNEVDCLREYAARLLEECRPHGRVDALSRVTSLLKLRVSSMAQHTAQRLRESAARAGGCGDELAEDASELGYMRLQPTADERILRSLAAS